MKATYLSTVRLRDLGRIVTGKTPSSKKPELFGDAYPFITPSEMEFGRRIAKPVRFLSEAGARAQASLMLPPGSVAFVCIASIGKACVVKEASFTNQQVNSIVVDTEHYDPDYVYYLLVFSRRRIQSYAGGAATPIINKSDFGGIEVSVPPLPVQRIIASALSSYDDLIENNMRRIEILEEMARRLYEEWFVQFRFPGHEGVEFKESELGLIPEGWKVVALETAVEINPKTKVERDGEKVFVPMGALSETGMVISGWEIKSGNSGAKFQNGDTLVARISPCLENGKTGFVDFLPANQPTACGSTEFIVLRSRSLCPEMVYCLSRSDRFREVAMKSMSGATGRQRVRVESLLGYPIAQPENELVAKYHAFAQPCFKEIRVLANKNANLRQQRDLLLPKLISGEIDVSDIPMPT